METSASIFIVDIETTGFDPIFDRVLEIGIVELNTITNQFKPIYEAIVKQDTNQIFIKNCWLVQNNYMTLEEIESGKEQLIVQSEVKSILEGKNWTAFNANFDGSFLKHQLKIDLLSPAYDLMLDTTNIVRIPHYNGDFKWPNVPEAYYYFMHEKIIEKHRALSDALQETEICIAYNNFLKRVASFEMALQNDCYVTIDYTDKKNDKTYERTIKPLEFKRGKTLIEAFDNLRNENRTFNLTRINSLEIL